MYECMQRQLFDACKKILQKRQLSIARINYKKFQVLIINTMFLGGRYKNKRRLGKGGFGNVYLVEDQQGTEYALKLIQSRRIRRETHLKQYLKGQIKCMKSMECQNIIKLYHVDEDPNYIYLLLEYCDGGDLIYYQGNLKDKVFTLNQATKVLADVILGLQELHRAGYLHRDIKPQNILLKKQNGKQVVKLADFGFSKKSQDICKTILGTSEYMSPEVLSDKPYGYEIDMWAFGVTFYFLLNQELPFKFYAHANDSKNRQILLEQAKNFSYNKSVQKSKKRLLKNCTPQVEDLFRRIFDLDPDRRISFIQIREHPVFAVHFPAVKESSKIFYGKKISVMNLSESNNEQESNNDEKEQIIPISFSRIKIKNEQFQDEQNLLIQKKDEIDFIKQIMDLFIDCGAVLKDYQKLMLAYNLQKYYIILLRKFKVMLTLKQLERNQPKLKWSQYLKTKDFRQIDKEVDEDLNEREMKFSQLFDQCQNVIKQISKINDKFCAAFNCNINEDTFDGAFKKSYRQSTSRVYVKLKDLIKNKDKQKYQLYLLIMIIICHAFNRIVNQPENVAQIFAEYIAEKKVKATQIDYSDLREWISKSSRENLEKIFNEIKKQFID